MENRPSATAIGTAFARAYHVLHDSPKIFDDVLAPKLFTAEEHVLFAKMMAAQTSFYVPEQTRGMNEEEALAYLMQNRLGPITLSRSKYTEDCLHASKAEQYVILGAGLDTYAWRQPEREEVFELDHLATQEYKRMKTKDWEQPKKLHMIPADFREAWTQKLLDAGYDTQKLTFFSWLGVSYYLPKDKIKDMLQAIRSIAPSGSMLVFDYFDAEAFGPHPAPQMERMRAFVQQAGEPMLSGFAPTEIQQILAQCGLTVQEDLSPEDIQERFFTGRTDGYKAFPHTRFLRAVMQ